MRVKINKIEITGEGGKTIKRPTNMYIDSFKLIEELRSKFKENDDDTVRFQYEEVED